jgi:hypothetical protein
MYLNGALDGENVPSWPHPLRSHDRDHFAIPSIPASAPRTLKNDENDLSYDANYQSHNDSTDAFFHNLYNSASNAGEQNTLLSHWLANPSVLDPIEHKAESLLSYCYPDAPRSHQGRASLKNILTVDNIQHFLECYKHFHSHWPLIHLASFRIQETTDALLLAMIAVGTVYSERIPKGQGRWLMEVVKLAINRSAHVLQYEDERFDIGLSELSASDLQEFQALSLLQVLYIWHGTKEHRCMARESIHPSLARLAKRLNFHHTFGYSDARCSYLHEPGPLSEQHPFVWERWIEQEMRVRIMYIIFLLDVAFVIFFNSPPQFDFFEFCVPLPSDDESFEAVDGKSCADVLGLNGAQILEMKNLTGSRRLKQIQFQDAMKFLLQHPSHFARRSTNAFSKFILIHALHVQIWSIQRQHAESRQGQEHVNGLPWASFSQSASGTSTPLSSHDWVAPDGRRSASQSGRATPTDVSAPSAAYPPQALQQLRQVANAIEKWHLAWTKDIEEQYHQSPASGVVIPRVGFCRDAEHYYYLAKHFIYSTAPYEWQVESELRMQQVFGLLNQIKNAVASEHGKKGEQIGSVAKMNDGYAAGEDKYNAAIASITLDMEQLFTPVSRSQ